MDTKIFLGERVLRVEIAVLSTNCPSFKEDLPYQVRSPVGGEAFHIFVAALEGTAPVLTTENMSDLLSLCNEFGFTGLLSQGLGFISAHSVVEDGMRKAASDITKEKLQIRQALCPLYIFCHRRAFDSRKRHAWPDLIKHR
jgi:hypothetical protein